MDKISTKLSPTPMFIDCKLDQVNKDDEAQNATFTLKTYFKI